MKRAKPKAKVYKLIKNRVVLLDPKNNILEDENGKSKYFSEEDNLN